MNLYSPPNIGDPYALNGFQDGEANDAPSTSSNNLPPLENEVSRFLLKEEFNLPNSEVGPMLLERNRPEASSWMRNAGRKKSHPVWDFFKDMRAPGITLLSYFSLKVDKGLRPLS